MMKERNGKFITINLIVCGLLFYLLDRFSLFINDDYYYSFISGSGLPIDSIADVIKSQSYDYFHTNGRFIVHSIVQFFCGMVGMDIFACINSVVFVLFLYYTLKFLVSKRATTKVNHILLVFLMLFLVSGIPYIYLNNIACAVNYLWTSCVILMFMNLYDSTLDGKKKSTLVNVMSFLFAVVVGAFQESFSIGLSGALFIYYCFNLKKLKGSILYLVIGLWIGTCLVTLNPANLLRFGRQGGSMGESLIMQIITRVYTIILNTPILDLLILVLSVSYYKYRDKTKQFLKENCIWLWSIVINSLFVIFIAYTGAHQLTSISLFSLIVLMKFILTCHKSYAERYGKLVAVIAALFIFVLYIPVYKYRYEIHRGHNELVDKAGKTKDGIVIAPEYCKCCAGRTNWIAWNFTRHEIYKEFSKKGISLWLTRGERDDLVTSILPDSKENIISNCIVEHELNDNFYKTNDGYYFVLRLKKDVDVLNNHIEVSYKPNLASKIKGMIKNVSPVMKEYFSLSTLDTFDDSEYNYFVLYDDDPSRRIINVDKVDGPL